MVRVVGCVLLFASLFFTAHILLEQQVQCTKVLERNDEHGIYYANFISDLYHYLNVSKIGSGLVTELRDCALACLKVVTCFSFNLAASPDIEGKLWCEHLPSDKYNSSDKFQANALFHHYSIYTPCSKFPCENEGKCIPLYKHNDFKCACAPTFKGKRCEKVSHVCQPVGIQDENQFPDNRMNATSVYSTSYLPHYARLHGTRSYGWCPSSIGNVDYLQVDLGVQRAICAMATQGDGSGSEFPTLYKLSMSLDGHNWSFYKEQNKDKEFPGNSDGSTVVKHLFHNIISARYVRYYPLNKSRWPTSRIEIFALK